MNMVKVRQISFCFFFLLLLSVAPSFAQNQPETPTIYEQYSVCGPAFFQLNSVPVTEDEAACLDEITLRLKMDETLSLVIDAHRHSIERKGISLTRAYYARRYLHEFGGIALSRITVRNFS